MENCAGLLRIRALKATNLAVRDIRSSDPYVIVTMGDQKLKTRVMKNSCNPEWPDELTLLITNPDIPIKLAVYDKDTATLDDRMGEAEIDIKPCFRHRENLSEGDLDGTVIFKVEPSEDNFLTDQSCITWKDGHIVQDISLRLKNVESGELQLQLLM